MKHEQEFNKYLKVLNERKNMSLMSTIFFLILTVIVITYLNVEFSVMNIISLLLILSFFVYSIIKLINNDAKLNHVKIDLEKYINHE